MSLSNFVKNTIKVVGTVTKVSIEIGTQAIGSIAEKIDDKPQSRDKIVNYGKSLGQTIKKNTNTLAENSVDVVEKAVDTGINTYKNISEGVVVKINEVTKNYQERQRNSQDKETPYSYVVDFEDDKVNASCEDTKEYYRVIKELYTDLSLFKVFTSDLNDRYLNALIKATELALNNKLEQGKQLLIENGEYAQSRDDVNNFLYMNYNACVLDYYYGNNPDILIEYTLRIDAGFIKSNVPTPKWLIQSYELVSAAFLEVGYRDNNKECFEYAKVLLNEEIEYDSKQELDDLNAWIMFAEVFYVLGDMEIFKIRVKNLRDILLPQEFQIAKNYWRKHGINV